MINDHWTLIIDHSSAIGARGFEPPTSWSRTRRANRAALRPATVGRSDCWTVGLLGVGQSGCPTVRPSDGRAPRRTRTPSLLIRSQALYPVELWARPLS